ncbi:VIT domain-containing protein [Nannocystis punicea]|uniref:VIT domain-containing protein n=1 Tax=Nannocystis punicea TaxID=2995304 RepID=A0ABY7HFW6_9BACT|nr:VIT domain-containing protein [Nannocystis poenicansa]WAS97998.1 VIT domain-containing protein [Nannocystis poenicansa]
MMPTALTIDPTLTHTSGEHAFGRLETSHGLLPLAALSVAAHVRGLEVATEIHQTFVNHTGAPIEATYIFPLPDRAAVYAFRMQLRDRVVEGVIDERGRARDVYEHAIAVGQRAAIAEEDRPGVFTLRVGNLVPGDHAVLTLRTVGPLPIEDGEVTWAFPLVVAPRYIPGVPLLDEQAGTGTAPDTDRVPDASRISPPVLLPGFASPVRLSIRVTLDGAGLPVTGLRSSLHEVHAVPDRDGWHVELRPGQRLDRDFILRWTLGGAALHSAAVWALDDDGEGATAMITLVPPVGAAAQGRPRDVVLVLDRSGSMGGWKMVAARRAAARIVDTLGERDRFAVLAFDDAVESPPTLGEQLVAGSDRHRFRAVEYLAGVQARGGTELARPLELATRLLAGHDDRDRVLVLVTDGQVGNEDELLRRHGAHLQRVRVFTLGIDQAVNAGFLRRLAAVGGGACELVESEERLDEVMAKIHRRIATPVLVDVSLNGDGLDLATQAPRRLPAVFAGAPLVVHARWRGRPRPGATLELRGRLPAGTEYTQRLHLDSARPGAALAQSWARAHLRDLEDRYAAVTTPGDRAALERSILAVSLRHHVLSRFTAFVAVDRDIVNPGGNPRTLTQPVDSPAGWTDDRFGAAQPAPLGEVPSDLSDCLFSLDTLRGARQSAPVVPSAPMAAGPGAPAPRSGSGQIIPGPRRASAAPPPAAAEGDARSAPRAGGSASSIPATGSASRPVGAPPPSPPRAPAPAPQASAAAKSESRDGAGFDPAPYLARLFTVVDDLERAAGAATPDAAAQLPVARLSELLEDLRTVGLDALAARLAPIVDRLREALIVGRLLPILKEILAALRELAGDGGVAPQPPPRKRKWFWR